MAVNRSSAVRADLPFLSRRVKPRAAAPAAPAAPAAAAPSVPRTTPAPATPATPAQPRTTPSAPAPGSLSLSPSQPSRPAQPSQPSRHAGPPSVSPSLSLGLSPNAEAASSRASGAPSSLSPSASARSVPAPLHTRLFPAPGTGDLRTLDRQDPVLRLTPMESAVGSLAVAGSLRAVWEGPKYATGSVASGELLRGKLDGVMVQAPGNRPLVGYEGELALIPLRHVGMLRRALFFPKPKQPLSVGIYNGHSVTLPAQAGPRSFYVLSVIRIGNVLELRAEELPYGMDFKTIWEAFGFSMTTQLPYQGR